MRTVEAFLMGALVLIGLYLAFNSQNVGSVISATAGGLSKVFGTLQGRGGIA